MTRWLTPDQVAAEHQDGRANPWRRPREVATSADAREALNEIYRILPGKEASRPRYGVYFIQSGEDGPVKIGYSLSPRFRLSQLQSGQHERLRLVLIIPGKEDLEQRLHWAFSQLRIRGEWFSPGYDLQAFVVRMQKRFWRGWKFAGSSAS